MSADQPVETKPVKKRRIDVTRETSDKSGIKGLLELCIRKFRNFSFVFFLIPMVGVCTFAIGLSLVPAIYFFRFVYDLSAGWATPFDVLALGWALAIGYLLYGMTLIFVVPALNFILCIKLKAWRGIWFSIESIPWYVHNALTYVVRYTFLEMITPTPWNILFYRMMGMKIGKGVTINTTNISDPSLIELDDYVTIGGSAHLLAHYGQKGFLVLSPVKIGKNTTIGLKASVMGGARIGENCTVRPHVAVLPNTVVPDGESFG